MLKTINEYLELSDKYAEQNNTEKASVYLSKAISLNQELWKQAKNDIQNVLKKANLPEIEF